MESQWKLSNDTNMIYEFKLLRKKVYEAEWGYQIKITDDLDKLSQFILFHCNGELCGGARITRLDRAHLPMEHLGLDLLEFIDEFDATHEVIEVSNLCLSSESRALVNVEQLLLYMKNKITKKSFTNIICITPKRVLRMYKIIGPRVGLFIEKYSELTIPESHPCQTFGRLFIVRMGGGIRDVTMA